MTSSTSIAIHVSPQDYIEISRIKDFGDGSYTSRLAVGSWPFSCADHLFDFDNLSLFREDISKAFARVEGMARLKHTYEKDYIEFAVHDNGHVTISGFVIRHGPPTQELNFCFSCDQTYLPELIRSLEQVTKELER